MIKRTVAAAASLALAAGTLTACKVPDPPGTNPPAATCVKTMTLQLPECGQRAKPLDILVSFREPMTIELTIDAHTETLTVQHGPWARHVDIWKGQASVYVTGKGYHSCQIWVDHKSVDGPHSANLGPIRCSVGIS